MLNLRAFFAVFCVGFCTLMYGSIGNAEEHQGLHAGAATSNITPPLGEKIVGGWAPFPAANIHDELHARALVLSDGETRLAFVICDNVGIPRDVFDRAKEMIVKETDIPYKNLLMSATHTHSATTARGESKVEEIIEFTDYQKFLARRIADSVRLALNRLQPAEIGFGSIDEPSALNNRRWHVTDPELRTNPFGGVDKVRMNPPSGNPALVRPAGPIDPQIAFISVRTTDGKPLALLANYSLHYVGGVKKGDVSADYFGIFCKEIAKRLDADNSNPAFVGILTNGTSGDINNINFTKRGPRKAPYEQMQHVAELVADRVYEAHAAVKFQSSISLAAEQSDLRLKVRKPTSEMLAYFDKIDAIEDQDASHHVREKIYSARVRRLAEGPDVINVPLQVFRVGNVGISAIPFEVFAEIGLELKEKLPAKNVFTIELANGSYGYLPTPSQHELGGYETWMGTCNVEKEASVKIVNRLLSMFDKIKETK